MKLRSPIEVYQLLDQQNNSCRYAYLCHIGNRYNIPRELMYVNTNYNACKINFYLVTSNWHLLELYKVELTIPIFKRFCEFSEGHFIDLVLLVVA